MPALHGDVAIRLVIFLGLFFVMAVWEILAPRRRLTESRKKRWLNNFVLISLNPLLVYIIFPILPVGMALLAQSRGWGMLHAVSVPYPLAVLIGVIALDFVIYLQHVLFHRIPVLWRLHMVHHADLDIDVSTGLRFYPIEIAVSMGIKLTAVWAIGPPALAVLIFEIVLNSMSMFNHGNVYIPPKLDEFLRLFVVTPDMHRVHHSIIPQETGSNFGFNLPWWDRLLGTYRSQPSEGHEGMTIGLSYLRDPEKLNLPRLLILPFVH
ncbi:MAG: sterol desaturase family protein [Syntrophobacteraceae bacterium]